MKKRYFSLFFKTVLVWLVVAGTASNLYAGDDKKRVVLQAFWWDFYNDNFKEGYANYLAELAPRLKEMGFNAVWVPPFTKCAGTNNVGYAPFDQYDLGDKYQKGRQDEGEKRDAAVPTRMGTKDDLLRMIAVMHANGIEVICDAVLNHSTDPGGEDGGAGGQDPQASDDKWKNFRYVCYKTPYKDGKETDYLSREGRWPKNWQNFHPNPGHDCNTGDWCSAWWGPDICYYEGAYGQSSNAIYNPSQDRDYMRNNARDWMMWLKKQTAVDGYRWDAVKHFPEFVQQDISWNLKYGDAMPSWCQGGEDMFNIGEFIDGKDRIDQYVTDVQYANGGDEFLMGAFDCPLHYGVKGIADGNGGYNIGSVVNEQLNRRIAVYGDGHKVHRSTNYCNSHDNFRPQYDKDGNYDDSKWGSDMGGPIHPNNWMLGPVYAVLSALDGNVCVFMEDLFNLNMSNRWTHHPASKTELPTRATVEKLIWCHQNLNYKWGDYNVRHQSENLLVVERSGRALICITDEKGDDWHNQWVKTDFAPGTKLMDYSGGAGGNPVVNGDGWVELWVHPVTDQNPGSGYAVWAPEGAGGYVPYRDKTTVQEWEMADDLGDSHCKSLGQGGALPKGSTNQRLVGKIYVDKGKKANFHAYMASAKDNVTLAIYDLDGNLLQKKSGVQEFDFDWTPTYSGWVAMKVWNNSKSAEGGKAWIKATYTAPATVTNTMSDRADTRASIWTGNMGTSDWKDCGNWEQGRVPTASSTVIIPDNGDVSPIITSNVTIKNLTIENGSGSMSAPDISVANGSLNVSGATKCLQGSAYICGNVSLGTESGDIRSCATDAEELASNADFTIFPSPAHSTITITSSYLPKSDIVIRNITGQVVRSFSMTETIETVDISDLAPGVYLISDGVNQKRFIINN